MNMNFLRSINDGRNINLVIDAGGAQVGRVTADATTARAWALARNMAFEAA